MNKMLDKIKQQVKQLKKQIVVVYLAYRHKDVKWYKKAFLLLILLYAVSPIDFIPDFIPVLGMLDDLILIPLGILLAMNMIPKTVWEECKLQAEKGVSINGKYKKLGMALIIFLWFVILLFILKIFLL
jgi:uncharacterized membrane protein YkvA (DUF1232 family)